MQRSLQFPGAGRREGLFTMGGSCLSSPMPRALDTNKNNCKL